MTEIQRIAFWLIPRAEDRLWLSAILERLARDYDAPRFKPHVTIFSGEYAEADLSTQDIEHIATGIRPFRLAVKSIGHTDQFTKTLFIELDNHPTLTELSARARTLSRRRSRYELKPHLSLLYSHIPALDRAARAAAIELKHTDIEFDAVQAVRLGERIASRRDVESWRLLACAPFLRGQEGNLST